LIDKQDIIEPRSEGKAGGGGEALPEEENNCLTYQKNLLQEKVPDRQVLFLALCNSITKDLSQHLTSAVIGTRWWVGRDNATLPEPTSSHTNCLKTRRYPKSDMFCQGQDQAKRAMIEQIGNSNLRIAQRK
jgi:hypothetical protein